MSSSIVSSPSQPFTRRVAMRTRGRGGRLLSNRNRDDTFLRLLMEDMNHQSSTNSDSHCDTDEEHEMSNDVNGHVCSPFDIEMPPNVEKHEPNNSNIKDEIEHDEDGQEILIISGKCFISTSAPRSMLSCLRDWFNGIWPTFSAIPNDVKQNMFNIFKAKYTWRAPSTEQQVYKIWKSYFNRAMASEMRCIRNAAKSRSAPPPTWMRREIFEGLWDIWEAHKFKDLQESNRKNRLSDRDGLGVVTSTSGTISFHHHTHRMAKDNGGIPMPHEKVFTLTHRTNKGKGPFVDDKSKKAFEIYTSKLNEKQSQSNLPSTQGSCTYYPELWVEAPGGPKNGRCYGFDNSYSENITSSDTNSTSGIHIENDKYTKRIKDLENQQMDLNDNFERRVNEIVQNIVKNVVSTALEMHGIYQGHQFSSGQFPSPGLYNSSGHFSALGPGYFPAAAPGYYTSHGYFPVPSHHPHAQYQVESQAHASTQHQPSENHHSSDVQIAQS